MGAGWATVFSAPQFLCLGPLVFPAALQYRSYKIHLAIDIPIHCIWSSYVAVLVEIASMRAVNIDSMASSASDRKR